MFWKVLLQAVQRKYLSTINRWLSVRFEYLPPHAYRALPRPTSPRIPNPAQAYLPMHIEPCPELPLQAYRALPRPTSPRISSPAQAYFPTHTEPCPSLPAYAYRALPRPTSPRISSPTQTYLPTHIEPCPAIGSSRLPRSYWSRDHNPPVGSPKTGGGHRRAHKNRP